jgi:hypothetical protein
MASQDDNKAIDGMIRRTLAHDAPEPADCPSPEVLAAYYDRSLDADEEARCELHFSRCARCREQLSAIVRAEEKPYLRPARQWLLTGRWLVPAIAMLLIAFVWVARRPAQQRPAGKSSNTPFVAISKPEPTPSVEGVVGRAAPSSTSSSTREAVKAAPSEALSFSAGNLPSTATRNGNSVEMLPRAKRSIDTSVVVAGGAAGGVVSSGAVADQLLAKESAVPQPPVEQKSVTEAGEVTANAASSQLAPENEEASVSNQAQASPPPAAPPVQRVETRMTEVAPNKKATAAMAANKSSATTRGDGNLVVLDRVSSMSVIKTPDPAVLWRLAGEGFVERSEDSGATWEGQSPYPDAHFFAGAAPTVKICWLVGRDGLIVLTRDAEHWRRIEPPVPVDLVGVTAQNASIAVVTAADGRKFTTSNGGKSWTPPQ